MRTALKIIDVLVIIIGCAMVVKFGSAGVATPPVMSGAALFLIGLAGLIRD